MPPGGPSPRALLVAATGLLFAPALLRSALPDATGHQEGIAAAAQDLGVAWRELAVEPAPRRARPRHRPRARPRRSRSRRCPRACAPAAAAGPPRRPRRRRRAAAGRALLVRPRHAAPSGRPGDGGGRGVCDQQLREPPLEARRAAAAAAGNATALLRARRGRRLGDGAAPGRLPHAHGQHLLQRFLSRGGADVRGAAPRGARGDARADLERAQRRRPAARHRVGEVRFGKAAAI
jgi:hypothetical protein